MAKNRKKNEKEKVDIFLIWKVSILLVLLLIGNLKLQMRLQLVVWRVRNESEANSSEVNESKVMFSNALGSESLQGNM